MLEHRSLRVRLFYVYRCGKLHAPAKIGCIFTASAISKNCYATPMKGFFVLCVLLCSLLLLSCHKSNTLFTSIAASKTGIDFENKPLQKNLFGILYYLYYYNGGGVAIGDVNNGVFGSGNGGFRYSIQSNRFRTSPGCCLHFLSRMWCGGVDSG